MTRLLAIALLAAVVIGTAGASSKDTNASLWATLEQSSIYTKYARDNPNESLRIKNYWLNGGAKPAVATQFGIFLVEVNEDRVVPPPPPPPPPTATITQTIADGSTIADITGWRAVYDANGDGVEDDPGSIRFLIDGTQVLSEINAPFGDTFATGSPSTSAGQHTFKVDAVNESGFVLATNTVTATVSTAPPPPPPSGSYPDASNTGVPAGTTLTPSGSITISTNNTVVSGIITTGTVSITGSGVTLQNSKVGQVFIYGAAGNTANPRATLQNVEIDCGGPGTKGIQGSFGDHASNFNAYRVNIHNCEDGLFVESDFTIQDSFIHDLATCGTCHNDGMQIFGGSRVTIEHNRVYGSDTSAIQFCNNTSCSPMSNTLLHDNLLAGGGWTLYCPKVSTSNFRILDNKFSTIFYPKVGGFGPATDCGGETQSGNVIYETGVPLTLG